MDDKSFEDIFEEIEIELREVFSVKPHAKTDVFKPPANIYETKEYWFLEIVLPGINKDEIKIKYSNNILTVEGKKQEKHSKILCYHCLEWHYRVFRRRFLLPKDIDPEKIESKLENGILTIKILKRKHRPFELTIE